MGGYITFSHCPTRGETMKSAPARFLLSAMLLLALPAGAQPSGKDRILAQALFEDALYSHSRAPFFHS